MIHSSKEQNPQKINILGVGVSVTNLTHACETIADWVKKKHKVYICVAPVSTLVECQRDLEYKDVVNQAAMVTPDGMPVVWLGRAQGHQLMERTYGPDLMLELCRYGEDKGYKHYFYGSQSDVCLKLESKLKVRFPKINIVGQHSPTYQAKAVIESSKILEEINRAKPDILWVALGSPKQDFWMQKHRLRLDAPVMIGIGAAFDFLAGTKPQAPRWMQKTGLEWFFRLCCEPQRLWKRYLIGNSLFIYYLIRDILTPQKKTDA